MYTSREKQRPRGFETRVMRRMFRSRRKKSAIGKSKIHNNNKLLTKHKQDFYTKDEICINM
jgi:hypothetical protein